MWRPGGIKVQIDRGGSVLTLQDDPRMGGGVKLRGKRVTLECREGRIKNNYKNVIVELEVVCF